MKYNKTQLITDALNHTGNKLAAEINLIINCVAGGKIKIKL